jgi:hypothetical protein
VSVVGRILHRGAAERAPETAVASAAAASTPSEPDPELIAHRERLTERFAVMQSELGGLFYEMAIRDHVRMEVLIPKAAALQRVDAELGQVERLLQEPGAQAGGNCPACGAIYARGAAFCSQCATQLTGA